MENKTSYSCFSFWLLIKRLYDESLLSQVSIAKIMHTAVKWNQTRKLTQFLFSVYYVSMPLSLCCFSLFYFSLMSITDTYSLVKQLNKSMIWVSCGLFSGLRNQLSKHHSKVQWEISHIYAGQWPRKSLIQMVSQAGAPGHQIHGELCYMAFYSGVPEEEQCCQGGKGIRNGQNAGTWQLNCLRPGSGARMVLCNLPETGERLNQADSGSA